MTACSKYSIRRSKTAELCFNSGTICSQSLKQLFFSIMVKQLLNCRCTLALNYVLIVNFDISIIYCQKIKPPVHYDNSSMSFLVSTQGPKNTPLLVNLGTAKKCHEMSLRKDMFSTLCSLSMEVISVLKIECKINL